MEDVIGVGIIGSLEKKGEWGLVQGEHYGEAGWIRQSFLACAWIGYMARLPRSLHDIFFMWSWGLEGLDSEIMLSTMGLD